MQLRVLLSIIGQLIAVPAALFLMPTTYSDVAKYARRDGSHCDASTVDAMNSDSSRSATMTTEANEDEPAVQDR